MVIFALNVRWEAKENEKKREGRRKRRGLISLLAQHEQEREASRKESVLEGVETRDFAADSCVWEKQDLV